MLVPLWTSRELHAPDVPVVANGVVFVDEWFTRTPVMVQVRDPARPLRIGIDDGELRLFHRRHLLRRGDLGVQGTVVRLNNVLQSITFESVDAHRDYLAKNGVPHSMLRRLLLFAHHALVTRAHDANTLRYLWIEAGFDHGAQAKSESA